MSKVLKIVISDFDKCSRDKRELSVVRELGHEVIVLNKKNEDSVTKIDSNFTIIGKKVRGKSSNKFIIFFQRIKSVFSWIKIAKNINADVITGHDLPGLSIGWLSNLFKSKNNKSKLVYDAHEYEIGRTLENKNNIIRNILIPKIEKFLISKCEFCIMVNDSIADNVQKSYKLNKRPLVVRNIPSNWNLDNEKIELKRNEFNKELNLNSDTFIVMYHGNVMHGRGLETLIETISICENVALIILGNGNEEYIKKLKNIVESKGISKRTIFKNAVPLKDLWKYVGAADVDVTLAKNTCLNHYYMLPNKLFEAIQSGTPVIGSNFPEIARILNTYKVGLTVDPENILDIKQKIYKLKDDELLHKQCKNNAINSKSILCWENEKEKLRNEYEKIL